MRGCLDCTFTSAGFSGHAEVPHLPVAYELVFQRFGGVFASGSGSCHGNAAFCERFSDFTSPRPWTGFFFGKARRSLCAPGFDEFAKSGFLVKLKQGARSMFYHAFVRVDRIPIYGNCCFEWLRAGADSV
jgi:hypothetical protein